MNQKLFKLIALGTLVTNASFSTQAVLAAEEWEEAPVEEVVEEPYQETYEEEPMEVSSESSQPINYKAVKTGFDAEVLIDDLKPQDLQGEAKKAFKFTLSADPANAEGAEIKKFEFKNSEKESELEKITKTEDAISFNQPGTYYFWLSQEDVAPQNEDYQLDLEAKLLEFEVTDPTGDGHLTVTQVGEPVKFYNQTIELEESSEFQEETSQEFASEEESEVAELTIEETSEAVDSLEDQEEPSATTYANYDTEEAPLVETELEETATEEESLPSEESMEAEPTAIGNQDEEKEQNEGLVGAVQDGLGKVTEELDKINPFMKDKQEVNQETSENPNGEANQPNNVGEGIVATIQDGFNGVVDSVSQLNPFKTEEDDQVAGTRSMPDTSYVPVERDGVDYKAEYGYANARVDINDKSPSQTKTIVRPEFTFTFACLGKLEGSTLLPAKDYEYEILKPNSIAASYGGIGSGERKVEFRRPGVYVFALSQDTPEMMAKFFDLDLEPKRYIYEVTDPKGNGDLQVSILEGSDSVFKNYYTEGKTSTTPRTIVWDDESIAAFLSDSPFLTGSTNEGNVDRSNNGSQTGGNGDSSSTNTQPIINKPGSNRTTTPGNGSGNHSNNNTGGGSNNGCSGNGQRGSTARPGKPGGRSNRKPSHTTKPKGPNKKKPGQTQKPGNRKPKPRPAVPAFVQPLLPETGEASGLVSIIFAGLALMAGLGLLAKNYFFSSKD
ncbi:Spy0128 family protein [Hutsoniella sourekii]|uniref:Spy0128 family protein n=1 Tax=Hutsoniella sourekii TaxID=87650 RepID=UPI000488CF05|nr:LPXTG cell wall anchor domain-containing protein [Hutsoniella sourekii]